MDADLTPPVRAAGRQRASKLDRLAPFLLVCAFLLACSQTNMLSRPSQTPSASATPAATATVTPSPTTTPSPTPVPSPTPLDTNGEIAFISDRDGSFQIYLMNADGTSVRQLTKGPGENAQPAWSPDGSRIAFASDRDGNQEIYIMQSDGAQLTNFSDHPGDDHAPAWSPGGSAIAFVSNFEGSEQLVVKGSDGSPLKTVRSGLPYPQRALCCVVWFSEGLVSFTTIDEGVGTVVSVSLSTADNFIHRDIDQFGYSECCRVYSPLDDSFLMISLETGVEQIYWRNRPDGEALQLTHHAKGSHGPGWSPDGQWVLYYAENGGASEVFVMRTDELKPVNLTNDPAREEQPAWRPLH